MKNHDRFYERFYERHWKTSWHWRVSVENGCLFHVCPPFFHIFSVNLSPFSPFSSVVKCLWRTPLQFGDVRRLPDTGDCFTWAKATWRPGFALESPESLGSLHLDPDPFGRRRPLMEWFRGWEPDVSWISMPLCSMTWDSQAIVI
jgi:hypothetical protein